MTDTSNTTGGMKASDLFIECLEDEGVEYIFGVPGEENLDFLDSLSRSTKIKLILTRHEQGAGFMAATYGRHTGKTGVRPLAHEIRNDAGVSVEDVVVRFRRVPIGTIGGVGSIHG